jgi:hypothetical protein
LQREKTSQAFRDVLYAQYKSSYSQRNSDRKKRRRIPQSIIREATRSNFYPSTSLQITNINAKLTVGNTTIVPYNENKIPTISHPINSVFAFDCIRPFEVNYRPGTVKKSVETQNKKYRDNTSAASHSLDNSIFSVDVKDAANGEISFFEQEDQFHNPTTFIENLLDVTSFIPDNEGIDYLQLADCGSLVDDSSVS